MGGKTSEGVDAPEEEEGVEEEVVAVKGLVNREEANMMGCDR